MDVYGYFSTGVIVFDRIFHKIVHSAIQQQIASGNDAVPLLLNQFNFFLFSYRSQVAENLIRQCCQRDPFGTFNSLYTGHIQEDFSQMGKSPGLFLEHGKNLLIIF